MDLWILLSLVVHFCVVPVFFSDEDRVYVEGLSGQTEATEEKMGS